MLWGLIGNSVSRNAFLQCKTYQLCCFLAPKLSPPMADFCLSHSSHLSKPCVEEKIRICMAVTQIKVGNIWGFLAKEMSLDNNNWIIICGGNVNLAVHFCKSTSGTFADCSGNVHAETFLLEQIADSSFPTSALYSLGLHFGNGEGWAYVL